MNYWWKRDSHSYPSLFIGSSRPGWCFALYVGGGSKPDSYREWVTKIREGQVVDDQGNEVPTEMMLSIITQRRRVGTPPTDEQVKEAHAVRGPDGLLRRPYAQAPDPSAHYDIIRAS